LSVVVTSSPKLLLKRYGMGVEVRQRHLTETDAEIPLASLSTAVSGPLASTSFNQAQDVRDQPAATTYEALGEKPATAVSAKEVDIVQERFVAMLQSGRLQDRRLDIFVGPYGFELMSGGTATQVCEHAARSLLYAALYRLQTVFAVHFRVQRADDEHQDMSYVFPRWPDLSSAPHQVCPKNPPHLAMQPQPSNLKLAATLTEL